jgi:hypothetical protein
MTIQRYTIANDPVLIRPTIDDSYIFADPAPGDTVRVEISYNGVSFEPWSAGDVTASTRRSLYLDGGGKITPFSIRMTRVAGSGIGSSGGVA